MIEVEGSGLSNGVNYAYTFTTNGTWFGRYECRVHRYFLDCPLSNFCTKDFVIGGCTWKLQLEHRDSGKLGMYLLSQNPVPVEADFCFEVINYDNVMEHETYVDQSEILPEQAEGCSDIASIAELRDKSFGFLYGDSFAVKLELRYRIPENQTLVVSSTRGRATLNWKLKSPGACGPYAIVSDPFYVGRCQGVLAICNRGLTFLEQQAAFSVLWRDDPTVTTEVKVTAINQSPEKNRTTELNRLETASDVLHTGIILDASDLEDETIGFLTNDWLTLVAEISSEDQLEVPELASLTLEAQSETGPKCVFCLDKVQTAGVLHGNTTHRCYCTDCARFLNSEQHNMNCPICGEKVDVIIEKMF